MVKKLKLQERGRATRGTDKFKGYGVHVYSMHNGLPQLVVYKTKQEALEAVDMLNNLNTAEDDWEYENFLDMALEGNIDVFDFDPRWIEDNDTYVKFDKIYYIVNSDEPIGIYGL